ncbi:hypothetical protein Py17XNL_000303776 [Plasmodium yoelii yoelii]|uniref:Uncharacterized protein n=1 Tax=Plasmodium yoelii yoelii TaxID=73239 RepID=A0AAF0B1R2_PLAYO|nr:hypothetical protein Py17XNL_000303776 [Plasmodium yoelii yoelii]
MFKNYAIPKKIGIAPSINKTGINLLVIEELDDVTSELDSGFNSDSCANNCPKLSPSSPEIPTGVCPRFCFVSSDGGDKASLHSFLKPS